MAVRMEAARRLRYHLLASAARAQSNVLSREVSLLDTRRRPGALNQGRLQPGRGFLHPCGTSLAGTLVVPGAEPGPADQLGFGRKPAHVGSDLGHDDLGRRAAYTGDRDQQFNGGTKRFEVGLDLPIDAGDRCIQGVEVVRMQPQQEAVMGRHPAAQCGFQIRGGCLERKPIRMSTNHVMGK